MKNLKKIATLFFSLGLIFIIIGVSYAFFVYNKSGLYSYTINGGRMRVIYNELSGNNIYLNNAYPLTNDEALTEALEFEFTITGYNESEENVFYSIEIAHGTDVAEKNRFLDSDMKLSLYENNTIVMENEVFDNLDNVGIYYGYIGKNTSKLTPTINNYLMRLWINDNVLITNTPENADIEGKNVYSTSEFSNSYASFKINVRANIDGDSILALFYDANGGENTPKQTSLTTNQITMQKPVMESKGFLGWSEDREATVPEYKAGDYYNGNGKFLYAVYGDTRNVMGTFPTTITDLKSLITEVHFINDNQENIDTRYNAATIKVDLTYNNQGSVKGWLEVDLIYSTRYVLYIGSVGTIYIRNCESLFDGWKHLETIDLSNADTHMATSMSRMFYGVEEWGWTSTNENHPSGNYTILNLDLIMLNTSSVTDMSGMFSNCRYLTSLDLSNFDTSSVTDMSDMFSMYNDKNVYSNLISLDISNFDTSSVTDMSNMFYACYSLRKLDLSNFDTSSVTDMSYMFDGCESLTSLDVSNFDTSSVTNMSCMFDMSSMYNYARESSLTSLDLSNFDTSSVTNMSGMFYTFGSLTSLDLSNFDTSSVTDMSKMFYQCNDLTSLDISNFDTSSVTDMSYMFDGCESLASLDLSNFDTSLVTNMSGMFSNFGSLTSLDLSNLDTSSVTDMSYMFSSCSNFTSLDLSNFDTSLVTNMSSMFYNCNNLTSLDLSNFTFNATLTSFSSNYYDIFYSMPATAIITVNTTVEQSWILGLSSSDRPSAWTTSNVVIAT